MTSSSHSMAAGGFSMSLGAAPPPAAKPKIGIAAFGDAAIDDDAPPPPPRDLVIPLTKNPWKADPGTPPRETDDLDEAAAARRRQLRRRRRLLFLSSVLTLAARRRGTC